METDREAAVLRHIIDEIEAFLQALPTSLEDDQNQLQVLSMGLHPGGELYEDADCPFNCQISRTQACSNSAESDKRQHSHWVCKQHANIALQYRLQRKLLIQHLQDSLEGQLHLIHAAFRKGN